MEHPCPPYIRMRSLLAEALRAEAELVELRNPEGVAVYKRLEDLTSADSRARAEAERARTAWLKERNDRRASTLDYMSGDRLRFEEERGRFLAAELLEAAWATARARYLR